MGGVERASLYLQSTHCPRLPISPRVAARQVAITKTRLAHIHLHSSFSRSLPQFLPLAPAFGMEGLEVAARLQHQSLLLGWGGFIGLAHS